MMEMKGKKVDISTVKAELFSACQEHEYGVYENGQLKKAVQAIAVEVTTPVVVHGKVVGTLVSSPQDLLHLAAGYALAEGHIPAGEVVTGVTLQHGQAIVATKAAPLSPADTEAVTPLQVKASQVCIYGGLLDSLSAAHHTSHGVHEGALVVGDKILAYAEDIGRHNVLDRLRGTIALEHLDVSQAVLVFSGRVPQSVITKVYHMGVRFLASRALPTSLGIALAKEYGITLVCGLRPDTFKVFCHGERLISD